MATRATPPAEALISPSDSPRRPIQPRLCGDLVLCECGGLMEPFSGRRPADARRAWLWWRCTINGAHITEAVPRA